VASAFRDNFSERQDLGAAVCVYADGEPVVDLWGGYTDEGRERAWQEDTLAVIFSATKGVSATCIHRLVEAGKLDLDAPIANYWPEFGQNGKERIPVSWILTHQAGLPAVDAELTTEEVFAWDPVIEAIAAQKPIWEPGSAHGYHARTYGWILGEVVRRVTGLSMGAFLQREVAGPLGLDLYIWLADEHEARVASLVPPEAPSNPVARRLQEQFMGPGTLLGRALNGPGDLAYGDIWNSRALHAAELPSSNGIGTARALAKHYAALLGEVDGIRLLSRETVDAARAPQVSGRDRMIKTPSRFGLGYMLPKTLGEACGPEAFGHPGAGGSLGFADPSRGLAFGYVMNRMKLGLTGDPRSATLVEAAYSCL
jgi:CubicO group peptidase (beta-lactamase class C family)